MLLNILFVIYLLIILIVFQQQYNKNLWGIIIKKIYFILIINRYYINTLNDNLCKVRKHAVINLKVLYL